MYSLKDSNIVHNSFPDGRAWCGELQMQFIAAFEFLLYEYYGQYIEEFVKNLTIDDCTESAVIAFFLDANANNTVVNALDNKRGAVKALTRLKRYVSKQDYLDIADDLGVNVEIYTGTEAFANPALVAPQPAPSSAKAANFMVYVKAGDGSQNVFNYFFDPAINPIGAFNFPQNFTATDLVNIYRVFTTKGIQIIEV